MNMIIRQNPIFRPTYSASGGGGGSSLTDGATINLTSSVSGTLPSFEFLGGSGGPIASGTVGTTFTRTNWTRLFTNLSDWKFSTTRTLSRSQSLIADPVANGESGGIGRLTYQYDIGAGGSTDVFRHRNIFWDINPSFSGVQLKLDRWQTRTDHDGGGGPEVVDGYPPSTYISSSTAKDNLPFSNFTADSGYVGGTTNSPVSQTVYNSSDHGVAVGFPQNAWSMWQLYQKDGSSPGTSNGVLQWLIKTVSSNATVGSIAIADRMFRSSFDQTDVFRYLILQNYLGNGPVQNGNEHGDSKLYFDDIYLSWSSNGTARRRIELINASTPGAATKSPVIQPSTKSGTTVTPTINLGHIGTGQSGLYIIERDESDSVITTWGPYTS